MLVTEVWITSIGAARLRLGLHLRTGLRREIQCEVRILDRFRLSVALTLHTPTSVSHIPSRYLALCAVVLRLAV